MLALISSANADQQPRFDNFLIYSEDRTHTAFVTASDAGSGSRWTLTVYKGIRASQPSPAEEFAWSTKYEYDGYPEGYLLKGGRAFVYLNQWFFPERSIVRYVSPDCEQTTTGSEVLENWESLPRSISHTLWLRDSKPSFTYTDTDTDTGTILELNTHHGIRRLELGC